MPSILVEDKNQVLVFSGSRLSKENTQITDIFVTFDNNGDTYANYRAEEDTTKSADFEISATGNKNKAGEDEYSTTNIVIQLIPPNEESDSDPDDYQALCDSLWTEPISFFYAVDFNESGDANTYQSFPKLSLLPE